MKKAVVNYLKPAAVMAAVIISLAGCGKKEIKTVFDIDVSDYIEEVDYSNIAVSVPAASTVSDEEAKSVADKQYLQLAQITKAYGQVSELITDRAVQEGDVIDLDYSGKKDGVQFEGGTATGQSLWIGSHSFIDGFEDGLIGVKPGETVDLNLTFPDPYTNPDLAGADVVFTCTVNGIIPEKDVLAYFNKSYGSNVETYDDFLIYIKDTLEQSAKAQYESSVNNAIVEQLINSVNVKKEFPSQLILAYQQKAQDELDTNATYYKITADEYAQQAFGKTANEYVQDTSYDQLKMDAVMAYIGKKENLFISDEEMETRLRELLLSYGYEDYEDALEKLQIDLEQYKVYFLEEDVVNFLRNKVTVSEN